MKLHDMIKDHVTTVLTQCGGNKTKAAKMLGVSRRSVHRLIHRYKITVERTKAKPAQTVTFRSPQVSAGLFG